MTLTLVQCRLVFLPKGQQHNLQGAWIGLKSCYIQPCICPGLQLWGCCLADVDLACQGQPTQLEVHLVPFGQLLVAARTLAITYSGAYTKDA